MTDHDPNSDALHAKICTLVHKCLNQEADPAEIDELERMVCEDAQARKIYVTLMHETRSLRRWATASSKPSPVAAPSESEAASRGAATQPTERSRPIKQVALTLRGMLHGFIEQPVALAVLVLALVSGGVLIWNFSRLGPEQPMASGGPTIAARQYPPPVISAPDAQNQQGADTRRSPDPIVARLTGTRDATWGETAWSANSEIRAGQRLSLKQGLAEIAFESGATVILEGPAEFEAGGGNAEVGSRNAESRASNIPHSAFPIPHSNNVCSLSVGKLFANVPPKAHGFTVHTPSMTIVDRGTQFGVTVKPAGALTPDSRPLTPDPRLLTPPLTEVQVFQGLVEVQRHALVAQQPTDTAPLQPVPVAKPIQLRAGEAVTSDRDSQPHKIEGNPTDYVRELPTATPAPPVELVPLATWPKDSPLKPGDIVAAANSRTGFHLFKIDPRTGEQTLLATGMPFRQAPVDHGLKWCSVAMEPTGNILVGVKGLGAKNAGVVRIDPRGQGIHQLTSGGLLTQGCINGLAVAADGTIYATYESGLHNAADHVIKINPANGEVTTLAQFGGDITGVCFDFGGRGLLVGSDKDSSLGLVQLGPKPTVTRWSFDGSLGWFDCVVVNPQGRIFVGAVRPQASGPGDHTIYEVGRGAGHPVKSLAVVPGLPVSMACDAVGNLLLGPSHGNLRVHHMDVGTGKLTVVTSGGMLADETFLTVVPGSPTAMAGEAQ